jgi:iron complex transport system ATP-binding protein
MMLRADKLTVGYGKKAVVRDIDFALLKGQFVCLLGPNGSGKSTILKTVVRMLGPLGGAVYLDDRDVLRLSVLEMARTTAVVLTEPVSPGLMTVYDIVMLGRQPHTGFMGRPTPRDTEKAMEALGVVGARELAGRYFSELSDGEKQKTLVARALAQEPQLIVLDEPTSHLDARHRIEVMLILRRLTQERGVTVIASLHDVDLALKTCDVALLVKDGQLFACGTPEDVLREDLVTGLYGLDRASFDGRLGGVELRAPSEGPAVFVVGGGGSGAGVYRSLAKHGFAIATGILSENDIDCYIAGAVGATMVKARAFEPFGPEDISGAAALMTGVRVVIDAGFRAGSGNQGNVQLLRGAVKSGIKVLTLRRGTDVQAVFGEDTPRVQACADFFELMSAVKKTTGRQSPSA